MTDNAHRRAARRRQKATGESYTRARRQTDRGTAQDQAGPGDSARVPFWSAPWIPPTADLARSALAALDRPLAAWPLGTEFDPDEFYNPAENPMSPLERQIRHLGPRVEWRTELILQPDEESTQAEVALYEGRIVTVGGHRINPRCLDDYTAIAYQTAEAAGWVDPEEDDGEAPSDRGAALDVDPAGFAAALDWAAAGICVLQESLPWPFMDCLPYAVIDNRPAHRLLYAHALLTEHSHPRRAARLFKAMVFMNPNDQMGARFHLRQSDEV